MKKFKHSFVFLLVIAKPEPRVTAKSTESMLVHVFSLSLQLGKKVLNFSFQPVSKLSK